MLLIVNPSAGGGRAGRALPEVSAALTRLGLEHRAELTRDLEHARELARQAAAVDEVAVAFGGDGLIGAVAGALSESGGVLGVLPGGRGNDFARMLGIPLKPVPACDVLRDGAEAAVDLGFAGPRPFIGIASCGFDSDANRIANQARLIRGNLVYAYGMIRALVSWEPASFTLELDGGPIRTFRGYSVAAANSRFFGGGMMIAPEASLTDGRLEIVLIKDVPRLRYLRLAPTVFTGAHVRQPNVEVLRAETVRISASRPFMLYADGDPIAELPVTVSVKPAAVRVLRSIEPSAEMSVLDVKIMAARAVGELARRAGRGGGTSLPGKLLMRLDADAIERLAGRLPRGDAVVSATNGKTTTTAMAATILERAGSELVSNRAGANMAGGIASTLLAAAGRRETIAGELGLFEVDEFWLDRVAPQLRPRVMLLGNLFRDQLDRYGELETIADRWAALVTRLSETELALNADDPLIADLGRERPLTTYFGVEDPTMAMAEMQHASDSKHCRRCGAPYVYEAIYLGHLGRYHCPSCGQRRPEPSVAASEIELQGTHGARFQLHTPAGVTPVSLPLPGLYNVYNALGAAALCLRLGASGEQIAAGLAVVSPAFGRAERIPVDGHDLSILLIKNPAGANEIIRTLILELDKLDLLGVLNDGIADGRDISWVWDADFELLTGHVRRFTCAGTRAAELALRLKYAGVPEDRLEVLPALPAALDSALAAAGNHTLYALPTYTALLELREELARRGHVSPYWSTDEAAPV